MPLAKKRFKELEKELQSEWIAKVLTDKGHVRENEEVPNPTHARLFRFFHAMIKDQFSVAMMTSMMHDMMSFFSIDKQDPDGEVIDTTEDD